MAHDIFLCFGERRLAMKHHLSIVLGMAFWLWHGGAQAAAIERDWKTPGDGLLTYDDVSKRGWLDLTETQLFKFPGN